MIHFFKQQNDQKTGKSVFEETSASTPLVMTVCELPRLSLAFFTCETKPRQARTSKKASTVAQEVEQVDLAV